MASKIYPKKPSLLKTKIVKHGSGYQVFDGRTKVQPTTDFSRAVQTAKNMEMEHAKRVQYWLKNRRK